MKTKEKLEQINEALRAVMRGEKKIEVARSKRKRIAVI